MAEFVSGLPLLSHPRVWEWVLKSCLAFKRILEEDARFEKNLIADGIPQILKSWDEEEDQACYCTLLHSVGKTESMSSFFSPAVLRRMFHLRFFHFPLCNLYGNVNGKRHILQSECLCHLGRCCFSLFFICLIQLVILLWNIVSVVYWNKIERDSLENHATATIYTNIHRNQWINFSHIFNLEMCIDWVSFRRNNEK